MPEHTPSEVPLFLGTEPTETPEKSFLKGFNKTESDLYPVSEPWLMISLKSRKFSEQSGTEPPPRRRSFWFATILPGHGCTRARLCVRHAMRVMHREAAAGLLMNVLKPKK